MQPQGALIITLHQPGENASRPLPSKASLKASPTNMEKERRQFVYPVVSATCESAVDRIVDTIPNAGLPT
jgi:hypothetical protein